MGQHVKIISRARRFGGGRHRILTAMRNCPMPELVEDQPGVVRYVGKDPRGNLLVVLVRDGDRHPNELVVFHVMPVRIRDERP